jgi:hypothetical protein
MSTRFRIVLPSVIGIASLPLVLWDIHNERLIASVGMGWDMGAPTWPYQAADILIRLLNCPAYSIVMPIANWLRLAAPMHLFLVVPAILTWWWFVGFTLDRGLTRWSLFAMSVVLVTLLLWSAAVIPAVFRLRPDYSAPDLLSTILLFLRFITPVAWFVFLTSFSLAQAKRVLLGR